MDSGSLICSVDSLSWLNQNSIGAFDFQLVNNERFNIRDFSSYRIVSKLLDEIVDSVLSDKDEESLRGTRGLQSVLREIHRTLPRSERKRPHSLFNLDINENVLKKPRNIGTHPNASSSR